jgi:glutamate/tyrosine decarboxylase-like PLP-dependent enzyme
MKLSNRQTLRRNRRDPRFAALHEEVRQRFFSRDPNHWPLFRDPDLAEVTAWRGRPEPASRLLRKYPNAAALHAQLTQGRIPRTWQKTARQNAAMAKLCAVFSKNWEHPSSAENVIGMSCDPAIFGSLLALIANPNLVYEEYAGMAAEMEKSVVRQIAALIGYDTRSAAGVFTQGGTFCNLYGYLLGIRKSLTEARQYGMGYTQDYRLINSLGGHYSNVTNLSLLGVNIRDKTIRIKLGPSNDMDMRDLEFQMEACLRLKCAVPTIMLTMGTTDTFGVDEVRPVYRIRNRLCRQYGLKVMPHIHVDSAVGWSMLFFRDYDCARNELGINDATLEGLCRHRERFAQMKYADSCTIDFQKWGYVPYTSSLVMLKDGADLKALENDPSLFSYFDRKMQGHTHLTSTIECSRGAAGLFGAFMALQALGLRGYQVVIAHCLQNANYLRMRLKELGYVKIVAEENQGPSVGFRIYNPAAIRSAESEFEAEYTYRDCGGYLQRVQRNTAFHQRLFRRKGKVGLSTNWIEAVAHTDYDGHGEFIFLPGEKAVCFNPHTSYEDIDAFVRNLDRTVRG